MTKDQMQMLDNMEKVKEKIICGKDMTPHLRNRTLLFGYTCDRETFHVYIKDQNIHVVIYKCDYNIDSDGNIKIVNINMKEIDVKSNYDFVPNKRLYPEKCDYYFCRLLKNRNIDLPFTGWTDDVEEKDFYGYTLEDVA